MSTLLVGHWTDPHTLTIEESHQVADGDQDAIDRLLGDADDGWWACEFDVDRYSDAIQRAYEEFVRDDHGHIVDDVEGHEPVTY